MKIYAPVKDFNGLRNNVRFIDGVGETNDLNALDWFRLHGYSVEKCEEEHNISVEKCDDSKQMTLDECDLEKFKDMTPNELRDWMRENGYGAQIKNTRSKEKLLEILRG